MPPSPTIHIRTRRGDNVRIGPISIITLIAVICMAVLAVLTASTSHASSTISERQAGASQLMYLNETVGQEFVAGVDAALADVRAAGGTAEDGGRAVEAALDGICEDARAAGGGMVSCVASVNGTAVEAEFICDDARQLNVAVTIRDDATYRISEWRMSSVQQAAPSAGNLWTGA